MAGVIGAGGLGNLAYLEGFQRNQNDVTVVATVIILVIVFVIQIIGDIITSKIDKR
jgi:D-methionine transport system permease protein